MEVLSGVLRRRNGSAEIKERIVSETLAQGVTVTEVARRHEVDRSLVYRWRRELGVTRLTTPPKLLAVEVDEDATAADPLHCGAKAAAGRSEEHTYELQSLMSRSYAVCCLKKKKNTATELLNKLY